MKPERGPILSWLLFSLSFGALWNIGAGLLQLRGAACLEGQKVGLLVLVAGAAEGLCVIGLACWKRWAAAGVFGANLLLLLVIHHEEGVVPLRALVTLGLLFFAVGSRWRHFD